MRVLVWGSKGIAYTLHIVYRIVYRKCVEVFALAKLLIGLQWKSIIHKSASLFYLKNFHLTT